MSANDLLLWMSARVAGSWQQFRAAVEELHLGNDDEHESSAEDDETSGRWALPLYWALRLNLQRFGHAEFSVGADGKDWRVTPPSLALTRIPEGWRGVLVGARSDRVLRMLESADWPDAFERLPARGCPDQIRILTKDVGTLASIAAKNGLLVQRDAPEAILTSLPPVDDFTMRRRTELPLGADWRIERFSTSDLLWTSATRPDVLSAAAGLFRFSFRYQQEVFLCVRGCAYPVPNQVGKYAILRRSRRRVVSYDPEARSLCVPASCRPPFLVERALILCTGTLPSYEATGTAAGLLRYGDVPAAVATCALSLLRQEIR